MENTNQTNDLRIAETVGATETENKSVIWCSICNNEKPIVDGCFIAISSNSDRCKECYEEMQQKVELRKEVIQEMEDEMKEENKFDKLEEMEGCEIWTDAFGERVCVGIVDGKVVSEGKTLQPTKWQIDQMWDEHIENELGSPAEREANLRAEFTPEVCKRYFEEEVAERIQKKMEVNNTH